MPQQSDPTLLVSFTSISDLYAGIISNYASIRINWFHELFQPLDCAVNEQILVYCEVMTVSEHGNVIFFNFSYADSVWFFYIYFLAIIKFNLLFFCWHFLLSETMQLNFSCFIHWPNAESQHIEFSYLNFFMYLHIKERTLTKQTWLTNASKWKCATKAQGHDVAWGNHMKCLI